MAKKAGTRKKKTATTRGRTIKRAAKATKPAAKASVRSKPKDVSRVKTDRATAAIKEFLEEIERVQKSQPNWNTRQTLRMKSVQRSLTAAFRKMRDDCGATGHGIPR